MAMKPSRKMDKAYNRLIMDELQTGLKLDAANARIAELTAEVSRLRDALQTIADNPTSLTGPDFTWKHWADIARNALNEG